MKDRAPALDQIRTWAAKYNLSVMVLTTIGAWLVATFVYGYFWVNNELATQELYGYERSRLLISTGFIVYRLPYLLIALVTTIVLEILGALYFLIRDGS